MLSLRIPLEFEIDAPNNPEERPLRLLCIGAHSDDIEIGASGLLLTLLKCDRAIIVDWVVCSATPERVQEAEQSSRDLLIGVDGVSITFLGLRENFFPYGPEAKEAFADLSVNMQHEPDIILTHALHDRHQDHREVARLTWNTWRSHLILEYEIPKYDGDLSTPNAYFPLAREVVDAKLDHLDGHFMSQHAKHWFDRETFRGLMRLRGLESNSPSKYAEAFYSRKLVLGVGT